MANELAVIIPTKDEEGNVEPLFRSLTKQNIKLKAIFIDDSSADNTWKVEENLKKRNPAKADVFHRKRPQGLGKALFSGYKYALENTNAPFIGQMDGDGQHDPKYLKEMMRSAKGGTDVVLGSRYVASGSVGEWSSVRRLTSWGANLLVKRALRGSNVSDATTGYRIFSRKALEKIVECSPSSSGYVFLIETLSIAAKNKMKIAEVPIEFKPRLSGRSKLRFRDKKEFFIFALKNIF